MPLLPPVVVGPFQCNCRILVCPKTHGVALIDPGDDAPKILARLRELRARDYPRLQVRALFHTHAHLDHIGATRALKEALSREQPETPPQIFLHADDRPLYDQLKMQGSLFGLEYDDPLPPDRTYAHEERLRVGELKFSIIHTPGHSPGSVSLRLHEDSAFGISETVFSGDTLFQGSVGRTDLWGANQEQMLSSIRERLLTLDGDTHVCPGHGPDTRIGVEKRSNPFLV
jgi:hydroxyacylglutathione hydrolase